MIINGLIIFLVALIVLILSAYKSKMNELEEEIDKWRGSCLMANKELHALQDAFKYQTEANDKLRDKLESGGKNETNV